MQLDFYLLVEQVWREELHSDRKDLHCCRA